MFFSGQREECVPDVRLNAMRSGVSGISAGGVSAERGLASRSLGEGWKNVYICIGNFVN